VLPPLGRGVLTIFMKTNLLRLFIPELVEAPAVFDPVVFDRTGFALDLPQARFGRSRNFQKSSTRRLSTRPEVPVEAG
jgi:hypothetical protein